MAMYGENDNVGEVSQDKQGKKWGYKFPPEQMAQLIIAKQIEAIETDPNLTPYEKQLMINHVSFSHDNMEKVLSSFKVK